jgi:hypothetical protein
VANDFSLRVHKRTRRTASPRLALVPREVRPAFDLREFTSHRELVQNRIAESYDSLVEPTPASRKCDPQVLSFKYAAVGTESKSHFQFDHFNFSDESLVVVS